MKTARMLLLAFCCAMLAGCTAPSGGTDALAVYSFCGETAQFSVTNGIIVLHPGKDILYGGTLTGKQDIPSKAAACSTAFFVLSEGGRHTLLSCESVDATGTGLDISGPLGSVAGENILHGLTAEALQGNFFLELAITDASGAQQHCEVPLTLTKVT